MRRYFIAGGCEPRSQLRNATFSRRYKEYKTFTLPLPPGTHSALVHPHVAAVLRILGDGPVIAKLHWKGRNQSSVPDDKHVAVLHDVLLAFEP